MILSIVIVNYNVKHILEQCLIAVHAAIHGLDAEVWVVDNHSTDDSVACLRPKFPAVCFIENDVNQGFAKANNQAIRQCKGKYILLLNPDTVIGESSLTALCRFMDIHPEAGAIGVKMLNAHGAFLPESKRSFPSPWVSFCKLFGLSKLCPSSKLFAAYNLTYLHPDEQHRVEVLAGAFMLIRHEALQKAGLFDESFFMYGEDIDLSYRITLAGYRNYYVPERILHYKGESTKKGDRRYLHAFYDAMLIFYKRYYPRSGFFISGLIRLSIAARKGYAALFERGKWESKQKRKLPKHRRVLVVCRQAHFETVKTSLSASSGDDGATVDAPLFNGASFGDASSSFDITHVEVTPCSSSAHSFTQTNHLYTDVIFCYPDISFDDMLLCMDSHTKQPFTYHIYHLSNNLLISPNY